jgi:hypothetical protein
VKVEFGMQFVTNGMLNIEVLAKDIGKKYIEMYLAMRRSMAHNKAETLV